jgi:ABC-type transport system involved in cytochrome c biogenesis permease subunit
VLFAYRPASFVRGATLAGATTLLLLITLTFSRWRSRTHLPRWSRLAGLLLLLVFVGLAVRAYFEGAQ